LTSPGLCRYEGGMSRVDWERFSLDLLAAELREDPGGAEGERMIWAFEEALRVARGGADLLPHFLAATACLLARAEETTPRGVLEAFFRRSTSDEVWQTRYLPLFE
jgi:hypothetical protein